MAIRRDGKEDSEKREQKRNHLKTQNNKKEDFKE